VTPMLLVSARHQQATYMHPNDSVDLLVDPSVDPLVDPSVDPLVDPSVDPLVDLLVDPSVGPLHPMGTFRALCPVWKPL
jgi:hypothetical protein